MIKEIKNVNQDSELPHTIGRYPIDRMSEKGGMGIIYQGGDLYNKRLVAVKVTLPEDTFPEKSNPELSGTVFLPRPSLPGH